jgi:hypothetical protein
LGAAEQMAFAVGRASKMLGPAIAEAAGELAATAVKNAVPFASAALAVYAATKAQSYFSSCYAQQ